MCVQTGFSLLIILICKLHIDNIYIQNELTLETTCKKILQVQLENNRNVTRQVLLYNLDMIISIGYRVNSKKSVVCCHE